MYSEDIYKISSPSQLHSLIEVEDVEQSLTSAYDSSGQILELLVVTDEKAWSFFPNWIKRIITSAKIVVSPTGEEDRECLKKLLVNDLVRRGVIVNEKQSLDRLSDLLPEDEK